MQMTEGAVVLAPTLDPLLPFVEAVKANLGISKTRAYELADAGSIEVIKVGRKNMVRASEINRLAASFGTRAVARSVA